MLIFNSQLFDYLCRHYFIYAVMSLAAEEKHTSRLLVRWTATLLVVFCLASCEIGGELVCSSNPDRVLLIYLGGDNNLSGETFQRIEAIKEGLIQSNVNSRVLLYHDPANAAPVLSELKNRNGQAIADTVAKYEEENSASEIVFAQIINEVKGKYQAKTYGLLLFSHASGWLPDGALNNPALRSVIMDGNTEMEMAAFASAIPDRAFDYIVFEACLMAGIEVAFELKDKTNLILASSAEIVSPGFTEIYPQTFGCLTDGDLTTFASQAFDYFDRQSGEMRSATLSVIRTDSLQLLAEFIANNCRTDREVDVREVQRFDRNRLYRLFFDFEDYYSRLLNSEEQRDELRRLISNCVVWKQATPSFLVNSNGFVINRHSGMTTYIPQANFPALNSRYEDTQWRKAIKKGKTSI